MIAVRPPEYWPRLEYFALMDRVDRFVLADTFQYSRQSFQNRAKLRTPQGWQWISVPLRGGQHGRPVRDVIVEGEAYWMRRHWRSLIFNYHATPFFAFYEDALRPLFDVEWSCLADLTCATVEVLHRLLGLSTPLVRASVLPGAPATLPAVLAQTGDADLLAPAVAAGHDAALVPGLQVFRYAHPVYSQSFAGFEAGMSVLDLLFNYGPEARAVLRQGVQVEAASEREA